MVWQWHQLDHMQIICTSLQTDNHASTSPLCFYRPDALPTAQPTASKHCVLSLNCAKIVSLLLTSLLLCSSSLSVRSVWFLFYYTVFEKILVHGQVTIIFVVSVGLSVCLFVQSFSQPSLIRLRSN